MGRRGGSLGHPQREHEELARLAVENTGLGNYKYKANKSRRKSLGTLR
ncbi:MAG: hypothetical protein AVDCRST_MAG28-2994 [uncultured Rubrobacteraceae bacterium]|uniref:Uncharacterized protein n=1 Tax=uncultured Rubrobacteraceae bacterium TaxID=349277 RepID=A0A6J4R2A3_9ACTN|nr:MAG: hypothetical protein AVDCRST_MAG28-2994 [uncultured Rubrobacteraceae bacterium]